MTVGENIQFYRKKLEMSQEELGQKLLVSRQTISLWEKGQTVPTIDNLIRLKEIFGVSVDEILDCNSNIQVNTVLPTELYQFKYSKDEFKEINKTSGNFFVKRNLLVPIIFLALLIFCILNSAPDILIGFSIGTIFVAGLFCIVRVVSSKKAFNKNYIRISENFYEYKVYNDYFTISISRNNEMIRTSKFYFQDIEQIQDVGNYLLLVIFGQSFILRKADLSQNSAFYFFIKDNPKKTVRKTTSNKWHIFSHFLFFGSLLSVIGALWLISFASNHNNLSVENTWLFFLMTPIPVASIVLGFVLKTKGYKYKKNIIVGIIMTVILCIYGSFSFIFADFYSHSDEQISIAEQYIGYDIPEYEQINTQDWTKGEQSASRGNIYYTSDVYFDKDSVENFEKRIATDDNWLSSVPNDLYGISSAFFDYGIYDYVLIYNIDSGEYNTLPENDGTYHFINIFYQVEENQMRIVEYEIDYIK